VTPTPVDPRVFELFDAISLIATIASLVLSVVAIWLSIAFKRDADRVNDETTKLLTEIRTDAESISQGVMSELRAYGDSMRGVIRQNTVTGPTTATSNATDVHFEAPKP
jgi:hypothetical protein